MTQDKKLDFLDTLLSLYIGHDKILEDMKSATPKYIVLDVRNAPKEIKKDQITGAIALPAKDLANQVATLDKDKIYVVYDWTAGTTLGKVALQILLSHGLEAYELASALEGWKGMNLPIEAVH